MTAQSLGRDIAVRLSTTSDRYGTELVTELASEVLDSINGVFLDKVKSAPPVSQSSAETDDLVRLMQEELTEDGFRQAALQQLEELRLAMPSEITDEFAEDRLDALLEEAIAEVSLNLHADISQ
ncbi:hypothetical protein TL5118_00512 [Thalassovita autumnalis]|uniref:Uncharacterized protein n=2 Tax=Thalassovita autumnalis TaxID=2072972 RepID=A0ABP2AGN8_9RHOB|nr:hypothetical protein TL5118_00512 [Thalassovita autumnalis]